MKSEYPGSIRQVIPRGSFVALFLLASAAIHAGTVYVSNWNNNTIEKFDSTTGIDLGTVANIIGPRGLAIDSAANLYAVSYGNGEIMKYTPDGMASVFATGLQGPEGLAFDSAGNLYVGSLYDDNIVKITPGGVASVFATGLSNPYGMAFDSSGNLYVSNFDDGTIRKFTPGGVGSVFAVGLAGPIGLAFDNAGNLYAANYTGHTIRKFAPDGRPPTTFASGLTDPSGLAFDGVGFLYVADQWAEPYSIKRYTMDGDGTVFASSATSNLSGPAYVVVVPEPSTFALIALALATTWLARFRC
jgi:DNA-binding beta-propeller fold protein YncE